MNFFEHQQRARRNSRLLLPLFVVALGCVVVALDFVVQAALWGLLWSFDVAPRWLFTRAAHAVTASSLLVAILGVSLAQVSKLRAGGGKGLAEWIGARPVRRSSTHPLERRLLNTIEEMALAAGTRVPLAYILDGQRTINAFAAGYDVSHCVIVVTSGALETLTRDELQAVLGHEFSHIVNGDTALDIRMVGLLHGLVAVGATGEWCMKEAAPSGDSISFWALAFGAALLIVGSVGLFFARLIKCTVSRQRELLADAAGVQYTRNPEALAGALHQMRERKSWVSLRHAEDLSHLFFGESRFHLEDDGPWLATHPSVDERIRRVAPRFRAEDYVKSRATSQALLPPLHEAAEAAPRPRDAGTPWTFSAAEAVALVGTLQDERIAVARRLMEGLPAPVTAALREPDSVRAVVLATLLAGDPEVREAQLQAIRGAGLAPLAHDAERLAPEMHRVGAALHLPIADLALPALRFAADAERAELLRALEAALRADPRRSLYRFAYCTFLRSQLGPRTGAPKVRYARLEQCLPEVALVLSLVAHSGCRDSAAAAADLERAFAAGAKAMELEGRIAPLAREACTPQATESALARLVELAPLAKAPLVKGLFAAITCDGVIRTVEGALLRMIGGVIDCPIPPLVAQAQLSPAAAPEARAPIPA